MATCITKEQWKEAYIKELASLRQQAKDGYDIEEALDTLEQMNTRMMEGEFDSAKKIGSMHENSFTPLSEIEVNSINDSKPKLANKVPLTIVSGYKDSDNNITYKAKYPNSEKEYTIPEGRVYYDQVAPKYGIYGNDPKSKDAMTQSYEKLEYEIWNDQENALKLFDTLAELEDEKTAHTAYLRELLEKITDPSKQILNEFKTYLNKEAESNYGTAQPYGKDPQLLLNIHEGSNTASGMSAAEMYVHEMLHMSVEVAKEFQKGQLGSVMSELRALFEKAGKEVVVEDLVENGDEATAKEKYKYIFNNGESGLSEFIAYAMTNEKFKQRLSQIKVGEEKADVNTESLWGKMSELLIRMYEALRDMVTKRDKSTPMDERIGMLVTNMWLLNNSTVRKASLANKIADAVDTVSAKVDEGIINSAKKMAGMLGATVNYAEEKLEGTKAGTALKAADLVVSALNPFASQQDRDATNLVLTEWSNKLGDNLLTAPIAQMFRPEGSLRLSMEYLKDDDDEVTRIEKLGLLVQKIDQHREHVIKSVGKDILAKFGKLKHKEQTALTKALIETDVQVLSNKYTIVQIQELMENETKLQNEIDKLETEIDGMNLDLRGAKNGVGNYYKAQAKMLGTYMTTGKGDSSLNVNASDIVSMRNTPAEAEVYKSGITKAQNVIQLVDTLATMHAIQNVSADAKSRTVQLMKEKPDAIENVMVYHTLYLAGQYDYKVRIHSAEPSVKGEIKDLKAEYVEVKLAHYTNKKAMEKLGFHYVGETNVPGVSIYKKTTAGQERFDKQAVAKINEGKSANNLVSVTNMGSTDYQVSTEAARELIEKLHETRMQAFSKLIRNTPFEMDGMIPMHDNYGQLNNYAVTVDKTLYEHVVNQDKKAPVLLGKMIGEIGEKLRARQHNNDVLLEIYRDMRKNFVRSEVGRNHKDYIELGPDARYNSIIEQEYGERVWKDMPQNMKEKIVDSKKGYRFIAVRRDMAYSYFGMRSPSILNLRMPGATRTLEHVMNDNNMSRAVEIIKFSGDVWLEIVNLIKYNIVIKTPAVIVSNIVSNVVYSFSLGQWNPLTGMVKAFKDTKEYVDLEKEKIDLSMKIKLGKGTSEDRTRYGRIKILQLENPVHELMQAGLFTSVASDSAMVDLKSNTRLEAMTEKFRDKVPQIIKDGWNAMYVTEDTGLNSALLMATAYGDFVSRVSRYQYLVEKKGVSKQAAMKMVTDEMVNYNRILGPIHAWLKEMGFAQFLQYTFGAGKSLLNKMKSKPTSMLMMNMLEDVPNPSEAMPWNGDMMYKMHDPIDILFDQAPEFVLEPATLRYLGVF
jgi:hypothetical protein